MKFNNGRNACSLFPAIKFIVFDFDGVFTDNKLLVNQEGSEYVRCDRADGYAFDLLRGYEKLRKIKLDYFILSTEVNTAVVSRAKKLKINSYNGINNKLLFLENYFLDHYPNLKNPFSHLAYLGNDLNDLPVMRVAGFSIAPVDAHPLVKAISQKVYPQKGGNGFVRAFIEDLVEIKNLKTGELNELILNR